MGRSVAPSAIIFSHPERRFILPASTNDRRIPTDVREADVREAERFILGRAGYKIAIWVEARMISFNTAHESSQTIQSDSVGQLAFQNLGTQLFSDVIPSFKLRSISDFRSWLRENPFRNGTSGSTGFVVSFIFQGVARQTSIDRTRACASFREGQAARLLGFSRMRSARKSGHTHDPLRCCTACDSRGTWTRCSGCR